MRTLSLPVPFFLGNGQALHKAHRTSCRGADIEGHHDRWGFFDDTRVGGESLREARGIAGFKSGIPGPGDAIRGKRLKKLIAEARSGQAMVRHGTSTMQVGNLVSQHATPRPVLSQETSVSAPGSE